MRNDEPIQISEAVFQEFSQFSEWRGTVKETLKHVAKELDRQKETDDAIWEAIGEIRKENRQCRDRCDQVACQKAEKSELEKLESVVGVVREDVGDQEKIQIKQQMRLAFYGILGGGLFSTLLLLGNWLFRTITG